MSKTSKSGKANKKVVSGGVITIVVAFVLIIVCFFTYISGVLPRTLTGISITETLPDGSTNTIRNYSVLESNFHFKEVYDSYSQYGMVSEDRLDEVVGSEGKETHRDMLLRETATQMRTLALVERAAKQSGFMEMSNAYKLASKNLETLEFYATMYGFQSGTAYLKKLYGTGMSKRAYAEFSSREILVQEYGSYLKQFDSTIVPTDAEIKAKYEANKNNYSTLDYSSYFIKAETDKDGKVTGMDAAVAAANKIANATKDTESFRNAVLNYVTEKKDTAAIATFDDGKDPTFTENFSYSLASYMDKAVKEYLFGDNKEGDKKVIQTEFGAYVIYISKKSMNDDMTVSYRMLTLTSNPKKNATDEEKAAALQQTVAEAQALCPNGMDPLSFYKKVKEKSTDDNSVLEGGYKAGVTKDYFVSTKDDPIDSAVVEAGKWLFEDGRKQGDVKVIPSQDGTTVYVFYFESANPAYEIVVKNEIITERFAKWNTDLEANKPGYEINAGLIKYLIY